MAHPEPRPPRFARPAVPDDAGLRALDDARLTQLALRMLAWRAWHNMRRMERAIREA